MTIITSFYNGSSPAHLTYVSFRLQLMDDFQKLEPVNSHQMFTLFEANCLLLFPVIIFIILSYLPADLLSIVNKTDFVVYKLSYINRKYSSRPKLCFLCAFLYVFIYCNTPDIRLISCSMIKMCCVIYGL